MRVYISGKITGLERSEAAAYFDKKEMDIHQMGYIPINPLKILEEHPNHTWQDYMLADIKVLLHLKPGEDAICLLHNWQDSKGAKIEHSIAKHLGLKIWYPDKKEPKDQNTKHLVCDKCEKLTLHKIVPFEKNPDLDDGTRVATCLTCKDSFIL